MLALQLSVSAKSTGGFILMLEMVRGALPVFDSVTA
jgi:hypothetical protein